MQLAIFSGSANRALAEQICQALDETELGKALVGSFSNGECRVRIEESVRGKDVFVVQPTCAGQDGSTVNDSLMQLLIMVDALRRAEAGCITAVIPSYGYARQDRQAESRTPISAKLVADLIVAAGVKRVVTVDLHAAQIAGFFDGIPVANLYASHAMEAYLKKEYMGACIVSPDAGGVARARAYAKLVQGDLAIIDKKRPRPGEAEVEHIIGDVKGKRCLVVDDMIDSAGTLCVAVQGLFKAEAASVDACASHGVFSGKAAENLTNSKIGKVIVTDSIPLSPTMQATGKIHTISIDRLLAEAIRRIHNGDSLHQYTSR
jgi:ribose-phosphate pyrophosphokinase